MPGTVGVKSSDVAVGGGAPPRGRGELVKIGGPVQVGLAGPKRVKVTVPVGAGVPVTVAVSRTGLPMGTGLRAEVTMVTGLWVTTDASLGAPHGLVAEGWSTSPL